MVKALGVVVELEVDEVFVAVVGVDWVVLAGILKFRYGAALGAGT